MSSQSLPIRQFLLTNLVRSDPDEAHERGFQRFRVPLKTLAASLDHMADFPFKDPGEVRFEKPTLFVRGTKSRYVADETLPAIGQFFPTFQLSDIEGGHWIISEQPQAFKDAVVEFLEGKA